MVQMFDITPGPSTAGMLGQALGFGLSSQLKSQEERLAQQQENKFLQQNFGVNLSGIRDPNLRSKIIGEELKGQLQKENQQRKSQLLSKLFPGEFEEKETMQEDASGVSTPQEKEITDAQIAAVSEVDPNLAKLLQGQKESKRREQIEFHKESSKFDESLTKRAEAAERKIKAIERQEKILPKLSKKDRIISALFRGTKYENLVKSQNAQEFDSLVLPMLEGARELFGVRLSDADLKLVLQKIATAEKDPGANQAILDWQKLESNLDIARKKIGNEIRKKNKGLRPLDYEEQINQQVDRKYGKEIEQTAQNIMSLEEDPEQYEKITERVKVAPGTPLTTEKIDLYLKISENDPQRAAEMAREDGYVF